MEMTKPIDSDVHFFPLTHQTQSLPAMVDGESRRNVISQFFSPLYQCSTWSSKTTRRYRISVLIWLLSVIGGRADAGKYGFVVVYEGNSLKISLIWPNTLFNANILVNCAIKPWFPVEASEMVGFKAAVASACYSIVTMIESRDLICLPTTVTINTAEQ